MWYMIPKSIFLQWRTVCQMLSQKKRPHVFAPVLAEPHQSPNLPILAKSSEPISAEPNYIIS